jgi:hypothetical protein
MGTCTTKPRRNRIQNREDTQKVTKVPGVILRINRRYEREKLLLQIKNTKVPVLSLENNPLYTHRKQMNNIVD